jgi:outer membrane murein-binding lipoprotein Lpp
MRLGLSKIHQAVILVVLALAVTLGGLLWYQTGKLNRANTAVGTLSARLEAVVDANATNVATIRALEEANRALVEMMEMNERRVDEARREAERRAEELSREREKSRKRIEELLNATPDCEALASTDISLVCPGLGERLLEIYKRSGADGDR